MNFFAVIDTNVLVSAILNINSNPGEVLSYLFNGVITPLLNDAILAEYRDVLNRPKFKFDHNLIEQIISEIESQAVFIDEEHFEEKYLDSKDIVFYEVTMTARNYEESYLITGNIKHFPQKHFVVTPRQMLDLIIEKNNNRRPIC